MKAHKFVSYFVITLIDTKLPGHFTDAAEALAALASEHPHWNLVRKLPNVWELNANELLESVTGMLPDHFTIAPMVYANANPPQLNTDALKARLAGSQRTPDE